MIENLANQALAAATEVRLSFGKTSLQGRHPRLSLFRRSDFWAALRLRCSGTHLRRSLISIGVLIAGLVTMLKGLRGTRTVAV